MAVKIRPFRFGISFAGAPSRGELVEAIKKAEDVGFEVVGTADHISSRLAVFPLLSTAAETSSMRVSPLVIANDYRHPVVLARDAATLDILSEGRFELGIGTGWIKPQYHSAGIPYDSPRTRVDRFEEALKVIQGCWSGEPFTFHGDHYQVTDVTCPTPVQQPRPPLLVAGSGRRMLTLAGREADIVDISPLGPVARDLDDYAPAMARSGQRIEDQLTWIKEGAGERFDELTLSVAAHHLEVATDHHEVAEKRGEEWGATTEDVLESPHIFIGSSERLADILEERRELYGISSVFFSSRNLDDLGDLVSRLAGT